MGSEMRSRAISWTDHRQEFWRLSRIERHRSQHPLGELGSMVSRAAVPLATRSSSQPKTALAAAAKVDVTGSNCHSATDR